MCVVHPYYIYCMQDTFRLIIAVSVKQMAAIATCWFIDALIFLFIYLIIFLLLVVFLLGVTLTIPKMPTIQTIPTVSII